MSFRLQSTFLTTHLASWGFVVMSPDYFERGLQSLGGTPPALPRTASQVTDLAMTAMTDLSTTGSLADRVDLQFRDYRDVEGKYDHIVSIEMIDHLCSPAQANQGMAVEIYREYFKKCASWVKPGSYFGFQAILRNRVPRVRQDIADLKFTADVIFPGGLNPRLEELIQAVNPYWEVVELKTRRTDYGKTTAEWLRRMRLQEKTIRAKWGDQVFDDYDRYLSTCVRGFANPWSSDVQMKLRHIDV